MIPGIQPFWDVEMWKRLEHDLKMWFPSLVTPPCPTWKHCRCHAGAQAWAFRRGEKKCCWGVGRIGMTSERCQFYSILDYMAKYASVVVMLREEVSLWLVALARRQRPPAERLQRAICLICGVAWGMCRQRKSQKGIEKGVYIMINDWCVYYINIDNIA